MTTAFAGVRGVRSRGHESILTRSDRNSPHLRSSFWHDVGKEKDTKTYRMRRIAHKQRCRERLATLGMELTVDLVYHPQP